MLQAEKLFLKLNAFDLYNQNYTLQQLELHNGFARIQINKKGDILDFEPKPRWALEKL